MLFRSIVDFGPAAGKFGGNIVFSGSFENLMNCQDSLTAKYLKGDLRVLPDRSKLPPGDRFLEIKGAVENNLKNIDVRIPVGRFISITGVSGAGKSSLINSILWPAAQKHFHRSSCLVGKHSSLTGWQHFDHVIDVNQQPIGRTPRSNPATYAKVFDHIRNLFAALEESKMYGYKPGRFSFNVKGGRCESCQGAGVIRVEMHFLADVFVTCEGCKGRRFNEATLRIKYKGYDISQILNLTVDEALEVFASVPTIRRVLKTIQDVGLGYVHLGQPATTLSGGEAQRIKLSRELAKRSTGRTLYLLDEPTTGLHFDDVHKLLVVLNRLVEQGNTVIVIEHNLDVIRCTDYVVDIGPDGGNEGGEVIFQGPVEEIVDEPRSFTGQFLKPYFSTQILEPAEMESMTLQQGE